MQSTRFIIPGVVVVIFFHCMEALFSPNRRNQRGVKWPLVAHTVAMFSFVTVSVVTGLYVAFLVFIENREFPSASGFFGYNDLLTPTPIGVVSNTPFFLNGLLADGLLVWPASNPVYQVAYANASIALSLSCHLCHEPLGCCLPVFIVCFIYRYVSAFPCKSSA